MMDGTCVSKRTGIIVGVIGIILLCIVAVTFYFIGASISEPKCENKIVPTGSPEVVITSKSSTSPLKSHTDGRLPSIITPILYKIEMFPYIYGNNSNLFFFSGKMELKFLCRENTRIITLNINKLNITEDSMFVRNVDNGAIDVKFFEIDTKWQFLIIHLDEPLIKNTEYIVGMSFTGPLNMDYTGLYLSAFPHRTVNKYVAATQFSPTDARKAFPCLDEPDFKAEFEITIIRRPDMISLSNMPKLATNPRGTMYVADVYERTPRMSTYLVAMAVGDFVSKTIDAREGLQYTSWAGYETINKTDHVLLFGSQVLSFFEKYFGSTFPLPKQDILAVPETSVGAMENWGLIIYKETNILYDETEFSLDNLRNAIIATSHELAHQWFGNLVTQDWWSNLFLKEGFAVYFSDVGIDNIYPEWQFMDQFAVRIMHKVFHTDGLLTSHPVHKSLRDVTEIRQVFDLISYEKGGCIIRMLNFILGDRDFQNGLQRYINALQYENADYNDLWREIEPQPLSYYHPPGVKAVMDTWILQKNYPVVTISQKKPGLIQFKQERFVNNPVGLENDTEVSPFGYVWKIPLTYTTSDKPRFETSYKDIIWMEDKKLLIFDRELQNLTEPGNWIVANLKQWGYYRVNYEEKIWSNLIGQFKKDHTIIHKVNRAQIINDLFSLTKAELVPLRLSLSVFEYLRNEEEYVPWLAALKEIQYINMFLKNMPTHAQYQTIIKTMIWPRYSYLQSNKTNLTMEESWLRSRMYELASQMDMKICLEDSERLFTDWKSYNYTIDVNIRSTVLCSALKNTSESDWRFVLESYNTTNNINEKMNYLQALTCPKDQTLINLLFDIIKDPFTVKGSDVVTTMTWLAQNYDVNIVWTFLKDNWQYFLDYFSESLFLLSSLVNGVTTPFTTDSQLKDLENFIKTTPDVGTAAQTLNQAVENTRSKVKWIKDNEVTINEWISESINNINY
ncbi:hypothetical protein ACF0H5_019954 [Mactra antiquata]